jgi:nitrogen fixation protein
MNLTGDIYKMKLHEQIINTDNTGILGTEITRVAGGWLYTTFDFNHSIASTVFVPFDNEFQEKYDDGTSANCSDFNYNLAP